MTAGGGGSGDDLALRLLGLREVRWILGLCLIEHRGLIRRTF